MQFAGLQKTTIIDYPGKISALVFTYGCNLKCPFCHNPELVVEKPLLKSFISESDFFTFLKDRKKVLDAVAITGGEPLLQKDIIDFAKKIKNEGLSLKIDTNGFFPNKIQKLIKLVDYWAMDIKNSEEFYEKTWKPRTKKKSNKQFFNFCKTMIISEDERSANEIYAAESLNRYVVGMFYGLAISIVLMFIVFFWRLVKCENTNLVVLIGLSIIYLLALVCLIKGKFYSLAISIALIYITTLWRLFECKDTRLAILLVLSVIYLSALIWLIKNFRTVRIKEVETVFAASFKLRDKLTLKTNSPVSKPTAKKSREVKHEFKSAPLEKESGAIGIFF